MGIEEGFYHGRPGSLIRLDAEFLKGTPASEVYLFYPLAKIRTAEGFVCAKPLGRFAPPQIGDRFLLFDVASAPTTFDGRVILTADVRRELVHESQSRVFVFVPDALRSGAHDDQLLATLRTEIINSLDQRATK